MTLSPTVILAALLAASVAGNAAVTSLYLGQRDKVATLEETGRGTVEAVKACQRGVDAWQAAASGVQAAVAAGLEQQGQRINDLQQRANRALAAKPANPADLCGSARLYLREQIRAERAASQP